MSQPSPTATSFNLVYLRLSCTNKKKRSSNSIPKKKKNIQTKIKSSSEPSVSPLSLSVRVCSVCVCVCRCQCVFLSERQSSLETALTPSRASRALPGTDTHIRSPIGSHQAGGIPLMSAGILFPGALVSVRERRHVCYYREIAADTWQPKLLPKHAGNPTYKKHATFKASPGGESVQMCVAIFLTARSFFFHDCVQRNDLSRRFFLSSCFFFLFWQLLAPSGARRVLEDRHFQERIPREVNKVDLRGSENRGCSRESERD